MPLAGRVSVLSGARFGHLSRRYRSCLLSSSHASLKPDHPRPIKGAERSTFFLPSFILLIDPLSRSVCPPKRLFLFPIFGLNAAQSTTRSSSAYQSSTSDTPVSAQFHQPCSVTVDWVFAIRIALAQPLLPQFLFFEVGFLFGLWPMPILGPSSRTWPAQPS